MDKLAKIQKALKAPKNQTNNFGKYKYRSCEDIVEAVKPLLDGAVLLLSDEIVAVADRVYVKATATMKEGDLSVSVTGWAREALTKKGMDDSQITGTASSYARKYALNGLFAIDDTKDADTMDNTNHKAGEKEKPWFNDIDKQIAKMAAMVESGERTPDQIIEKLSERYKVSSDVREQIKMLGES